MDATYLDELVKLSDSADKIVAEVRKYNNGLRKEYKRKEDVVLEKFVNDMRELAKYACKLKYATSIGMTFNTGICFDFGRGSYGIYPEVIISFRDDTFKILANPDGYSYRPTVYDDTLAHYDTIESRCDLSLPHPWCWQAETGKRFIALNADKIYNRVYDMICERFAEETKWKIAAVRKRSEQLIEDIARLEN